MTIAYMYELAKAKDKDTGEYVNWGMPQITPYAPNVPDGAVRNLVELVPVDWYEGKSSRPANGQVVQAMWRVGLDVVIGTITVEEGFEDLGILYWKELP